VEKEATLLQLVQQIQQREMFCSNSNYVSVSKASSVCRSGQIGDIIVDNITGCSRTMGREDLVLEGQYLEGDAVTIRCAHGDTVLYPVAKVELKVDGLQVSVEAAVSRTLPVLGADMPELQKLLGRVDVPGNLPVENLMVVTRAQSLRQAQDDLTIAEREQRCGVKPSSSVPLVGSEFDKELFLSTRNKTTYEDM